MLKLLSISLFAFLFQTTLIANQGISLASDYQKNSGLQWEWAMESLAPFTFNSHDKVLDVGCGDGKITSLIANQISQGLVIGMDISEKMIKHASSLCKNDNLLFFQGDATAIPFTEQFDKVVSFCTLHWILNQQQVLKSMKNCLKQGGMMLLVLPGKAPNNLASLAQRIAHSEKWSTYFPTFKQERIYFTLDEYRELLKEANLEVQSIIEAENVTLYKNKAALIDWIKPLLNFIDHLESDIQMKFVADVANQMILNDPQLPDGSIPIRHVKIEVIAIKV